MFKIAASMLIGSAAAVSECQIDMQATFTSDDFDTVVAIDADRYESSGEEFLVKFASGATGTVFRNDGTDADPLWVISINEPGARRQLHVLAKQHLGNEGFPNLNKDPDTGVAHIFNLDC